ncbi:MAG: hypothetical protein Q9218_005124 [Villophora microphyllina]
MPVYHIVLFKLKANVTPAQIASFEVSARDMLGKIPCNSTTHSGLLNIDIGPPLAETRHRAMGYDMGLVAVLAKKEDVAVYAGHPAHLETHRLREELCTDTLAYDFEFPANVQGVQL